MMTDIMKATYQTKIINPLKYRNIGVSDPKQTTVTRTVYILPATTVMYDQDVLTFLTKENGTPITDYTASTSPWKLTGDVYNGFQNSSTTVRYGYDNNLINYELSADHAKNGNNQLPMLTAVRMLRATVSTRINTDSLPLREQALTFTLVQGNLPVFSLRKFTTPPERKFKTFSWIPI